MISHSFGLDNRAQHAIVLANGRCFAWSERPRAHGVFEGARDVDKVNRLPVDIEFFDLGLIFGRALVSLLELTIPTLEVFARCCPQKR